MNFATNYNDVKEFIPYNLRRLLRYIALTGLSFQIKLPKSYVAFKKPRIQFLNLHHVFDDEVNKFDELLKKLSQYHSFISYSEAVERILIGKIDEPYITFSFDDGFKNNLNAAAVLGKYNAKACFFINPDTIGLTNYTRIKEFCKTKLHFPPIEFLDWSDVDELLKDGHEIGSHSIGHINLAETDPNEVEDNLNKSFGIIQSKCGKIEHFAFPFGQFFHFNQTAFDLVFKASYKSCASGERGCHISDKKLAPENLLIRRDHVICDWDLNHIMYFIFNNSKKCNQQNNFYPYNK